MFGQKAKKGLDITRESWQVLKQDRELLLFPVFSAIAGAAIIATIFCAGILIPGFGQFVMNLLDRDQPHTLAQEVIGGIGVFALYFVEWFVVIFFNTALVGCALKRFSGGNPTLKDGFNLAIARLPQILGWTLTVSIVGIVLSLIERRLGWLGKLIIRFIGLAWAIATYFVVPVLAAEGSGPITSVRRSVDLLKRTWGEGLTGNFVIRIITWGVGLAGVAFAAVGIGLGIFLQSAVILGLTVALIVLGLVITAIVSSAMRQIFLAGLYSYATTGQVPRGFSEESLRQALQSKSDE